MTGNSRILNALEVVPPPIDHSVLAPRRNRKGSDVPPEVTLTVGRISRFYFLTTEAGKSNTFEPLMTPGGRALSGSLGMTYETPQPLGLVISPFLYLPIPG